MTNVTKKLFKVLFFAVLAWGVFVRCWAVGERPFWRDEAWVARAATEMSYQELFTQNELPMPGLFAVAVKLGGSLVSPPELGLRLLSMICGVALLPLCYLTVRSLHLPRFTALAGMSLCASSPLLVIWSRELKQYEAEAFFCVLLAFLVFRLRRKNPGQRRWPMITGIIAICFLGPWVGYSTIFGLVSLLGLLFVAKPVSGSRRVSMITAGVALAALAVSVLSIWLLAAQDQSADAALRNYIGNWFIQVGSLKSWARAAAYGATSSVILVLPFAECLTRFILVGLMTCFIWSVALAGLCTWPRRGRWEMVCWVFMPLFLMLIAAIAKLYPFCILRMMAFWGTPVVLAVALGLVNLSRFCCRILRRPSGYGILAGLILSLVPVVYMINVPLRHDYWVYQDFPALLGLLEEQRQSDEPVLVSLNAAPCVRFYNHQKNNPFYYIPTVTGTLPEPGFDNKELVDEIVRERPRRWWLLTTSDDEGKLPSLIRYRGYKLKLVGQAGGQVEYGIGQLFAVTKF